MVTKPRSKVVVRALPANLTESVFNGVLGSFRSLIDWSLFVPGKILPGDRHRPARAYLSFKNPSDVPSFATSFDGKTFVDGTGRETRCLVEYASFQKVPRRGGPKDPKQGTILEDPDYQAFVKELEIGVTPAPLRTEIEVEPRIPMPTTTPLLEFLKNKHLAKKERRERKKKKETESGKTVSGDALAVAPPKPEKRPKKEKERKPRAEKGGEKPREKGGPDRAERPEKSEPRGERKQRGGRGKGEAAAASPAAVPADASPAFTILTKRPATATMPPTGSAPAAALIAAPSFVPGPAPAVQSALQATAPPYFPPTVAVGPRGARRGGGIPASVVDAPPYVPPSIPPPPALPGAPAPEQPQRQHGGGGRGRHKRSHQPKPAA